MRIVKNNYWTELSSWRMATATTASLCLIVRGDTWGNSAHKVSSLGHRVRRGEDNYELLKVQGENSGR